MCHFKLNARWLGMWGKGTHGLKANDDTLFTLFVLVCLFQEKRSILAVSRDLVQRKLLLFSIEENFC